MQSLTYSYICRNILVAAINEALENDCLFIVGQDDDGGVVIDMPAIYDKDSGPIARFEFSYAGANLSATLSFDDAGGIELIVVVNPKTHDHGCSAAFGRLTVDYSDPKKVHGKLILQCESLHGKDAVAWLPVARYEEPNGYSLTSH